MIFTPYYALPSYSMENVIYENKSYDNFEGKNVPHIQTRKIVGCGGSIAVTIPKPWADFYGLKQGDHVTVISNGSLRIEVNDRQKARIRPRKQEPLVTA